MLQPIVLKDIDVYNKSLYKTQYFRKMIQDTDYVLCSVSSAEYLGLYSGTLGTKIYVYTKADCIKHNIEFAENHSQLKSNTDYAFTGIIYQLLEFEPFRGYVGIDIGSGVTDERDINNWGSRNKQEFVYSLMKQEFDNACNI